MLLKTVACVILALVYEGNSDALYIYKHINRRMRWSILGEKYGKQGCQGKYYMV